MQQETTTTKVLFNITWHENHPQALSHPTPDVEEFSLYDLWNYAWWTYHWKEIIHTFFNATKL